MEKEDVDKIWEQWHNSQNFQNRLNLKTVCETAVDFYEGRQWAAPTEKTKNFPRPVLNIIKFIVNGKRSNILSAKIKILYKPLLYFIEDKETTLKGAQLFTDFAGHIRKQLYQEHLDRKAISDGLLKGTYIYHYFWDREQKTGSAKYDGGLNGQIIDPLNIGFANPLEIDEQKQQYILIRGRESVETIKALAKKNGLKDYEIEQIGEDTDDMQYARYEQDQANRVTVLTKYYRVNGEVYYLKCTEGFIIQKPTPLTPRADEVEVDAGDMDLEQIDPDKPAVDRYKITLYPIAVGQLDEKEKCIFGNGEVEQLINTQKAINFNYAMMQMAGQNMGFPKVITHPRALQGKTITNQPGEILTDYSPAFNGIRYLQPPAFSNLPINVSDKLFELTRILSGATEVVSGEVLGKNMSGSAIVALQNQAKVPIEYVQKRFWETHEKIGRIWEQFFKAYYTFGVEFMPEEGEDVATFNGLDFQDMDFATTVDVGTGSAYSDSMSIALLESMLTRNNIEFDQFVDLYPDSAMPFKSDLQALLDEKMLPLEIQQQIMQNPQLLGAVMQMVQQPQGQPGGAPGMEQAAIQMGMQPNEPRQPRMPTMPQ